MRSFAWLLLPLVLAAQDQVAVFGTTVVIPGGLKGDIYYLPQGTPSLRSLAHLTPKGSLYTTSLNVPPQDFTLGFPGVTDRIEWFAIDYSGRFWIENPGLYRFRLVSDDGAMLYIDGQLICDNDGVHSPEVRLGSIRLAGGMHTIHIPYFQGPRTTVALMLEVAGPGEEPRIFSTDEFKPPANPESWRFSDSAPLAAPDPDLPRIYPERIPGPEGSDSRRRKSKKRSAQK
ncbi:MAG TPA: PA14 domain-containing protein [Bryobacteraceae bacterium]|nr:PA14 domain-containing protein [Bryobacteraceae bacterium]